MSEIAREDFACYNKRSIKRHRKDTTMPDIWIRTDGNEKIATGHIMRCLSIARACAKQQKKAVFLTADTQSETLLRERFTHPSEFDIKCLHSDYQDMEKELPAIRRIMGSSNAFSGHSFQQSFPWILVDSYYVTAFYLEALHEWGQVAYLDDLASFPYPVDCIINYDIPYNKKPNCYHMAARCLLGAPYTPLRMQFQNVSYTVRRDVRHILISTGGTDPFRVTERFLDRIMLYPQKKTEPNHLSDSSLFDCHYHIITSRLNPQFDKLTNIGSKRPNIHIYENVQDMAKLMAQCDLAVSAGGTTLYELCAVGVPTISFVMADNQLSAVQTFATSDTIPYAGDIRTDIDEVLDTIYRFLDTMAVDYSRRLEFSDRMRSYVDGCGASRIAEALV